MAAFVLSVIACGITFWIGMKVLRMMAEPVPGPPPEGEMRKVSLKYRCSICGAELKMTHAASDLPEPPRHCMEDMELLTPIEL